MMSYLSQKLGVVLLPLASRPLEHGISHESSGISHPHVLRHMLVRMAFIRRSSSLISTCRMFNAASVAFQKSRRSSTAPSVSSPFNRAVLGISCHNPTASAGDVAVLT